MKSATKEMNWIIPSIAFTIQVNHYNIMFFLLILSKLNQVTILLTNSFFFNFHYEIKQNILIQLTFQRLERPTVRVRPVVSTLNTRLPNTRLVRLLYLPKVRDVMTVNNLVSVVKPSLFSTRRLRLPRRLF